MLPPAVTPEQREQRARINRFGGIALIISGAFLFGGSLALVMQHPEPASWLGLLLGLFMFEQGVWLVGVRDRRRSNRRVGGQQK